MTTLILGGSGQLGTEFRRLLPNAIAPPRTELELTDIGSIESAVTLIAPDRIINCAAYAAVDAAEEDESSASIVNGEAVGELTRVADALGIPLATFSSDYVFDGESADPYVESSRPRPINAYGRSKLIGERFALRYPGGLVVRTSWLLSVTHLNFVATILEKAAAGNVEVVDDQWGRPTLVSDLAPAVLEALERGVSGLLHLSSPPSTTWFGLAQEACRVAGINPERVVACSTDGHRRRARRPRNSVLVSQRPEPLPDWRRGLRDLVAHLMNQPPASRPVDSTRSVGQ